MYTANDMVHTGDKIEVSGGSTYCSPKVHIIAQVQSNLFTMIDLDCGNRICDPFPCKYGTRLRSCNQYNIDTELYGSFTIKDPKDAISSQSHSNEYIGQRDCDKWEFKIVKRFCRPCVFDKLARL